MTPAQSAAQAAHNPAVLAMLAGMTDADRADAAAILAEQGYAPDDADEPRYTVRAVAVANSYDMIPVSAGAIAAFGVDTAIALATALKYSKRGGADFYGGRSLFKAMFGERHARRLYEALEPAAQAGLLTMVEPSSYDRRKRIRLDTDAIEALKLDNAQRFIATCERNKNLRGLVDRFRELALDEGHNPVDNLPESKGLPLDEIQPMGGVSQGKPLDENQPMHWPDFNQSKEIGLQEVVNVNSSGESARERKPDAAEKAETEPPQPPAQSDRAAAILIAHLVKANTPHDPERVRHYCALNSITDYAAAETLKLAAASREPVRAWKWYQQTLLTVPKTPPPANVERCDALRRIDADYARPKSDPETAHAALEAARAALKNRKARP